MQNPTLVIRVAQAVPADDPMARVREELEVGRDVAHSHATGIDRVQVGAIGGLQRARHRGSARATYPESRPESHEQGDHEGWAVHGSLG